LSLSKLTVKGVLHSYPTKRGSVQSVSHGESNQLSQPFVCASQASSIAVAYESITTHVTLILSVVHTVHICDALTTMHLAENRGELCGPCRLLIDSVLQKRFQKDPAWRGAEDEDHLEMDVWHFIRHHPGSTRLLASAASCRLCHMIYDSLVELQDAGGRTEEYSIIVDRRNRSHGFFIDCPIVNLRYYNILYGFHEFFTAHPQFALDRQTFSGLPWEYR
jgi:hypothetical protein